nr:hypothetical protein [Massilia sp. PDC64]
MIDVAPLRRRAGGWQGSGREIVCGVGQSHYSIGDTRRFTCGNFFSYFCRQIQHILATSTPFPAGFHINIVISIS